MKFVKVNQSVVNVDDTGYQSYVNQRNIRMAQIAETTVLKDQINELSSQLSEMRALVASLINNKTYLKDSK